MSGPVPKRSTERRRRNKTSQVESVDFGGPVEQPAPNDDWHVIARDWYVSLAGSGQAHFYEPSDWQTARYLAEAMTRNLNNGRFSAQLFAAVMSGMSDLLTTEGSRRRARLEIERGGDVEVQPVAAMNDYRKRLAGG